MEHQNQNPQTEQTPQPDFSFIVNQPEADKSPKKHNKKVIVIVVLLVILISVSLLVILMPNKQKNNTQNTSNGSDTAQPADVTIDNEGAVQSATGTEGMTVRSYLYALSNGDYTKAYSYFVEKPTLGDEKNVSKEWFVGTIAPTLAKTYDYSKCTLRAKGDNTQSTMVISDCPFNDASQEITNEYMITAVNDEFRISKITVQGVQAQ